MTGTAQSAKDGSWAICSGGDQRIRGRGGYPYAAGAMTQSIPRAPDDYIAGTGDIWFLAESRQSAHRSAAGPPVVSGLHGQCEPDAAMTANATSNRPTPPMWALVRQGATAAPIWPARLRGIRLGDLLPSGRAYSAEQMHRMGAVNEASDHAPRVRRHQVGGRDHAKSPGTTRMLKFRSTFDDGLGAVQLFAGEGRLGLA